MPLRPGRSSRYSYDSVMQSILISKDHPDVQGNVRKAVTVAHRFRAVAGPKNAESTRNFVRFRQIDPRFILKESYRTFKVPGDPRVAMIFGRFTPQALNRPLYRAEAACSLKRTPTGKHKARPCREVYHAREMDLSAVVMLPAGAKKAPETTTLKRLLKHYGRSYVRVFSGRLVPRETFPERENPFAGYRDFSACVRDKSKDPKIYSPGGVCATIERRSDVKHGHIVRNNPVAEIIQTHALGGGRYALEYVDADDQRQVGREWRTHGVRLVLHGKDRGTFEASLATFVRRGAYWYWSKVSRGVPIRGRFDLCTGRMEITDTQDRRMDSGLRRAVRGLLGYVGREQREHAK